MGASFGAQGLIAQFVGSGNVDKAEHVAGQIVLLAGCFSLLVAVIGVFLPGTLLDLLKVSPTVLGPGVVYLRLSLLLRLLPVLALFADHRASHKYDVF